MDDMNALHFAAQKNSVDAARWLMNEGLSVNGKTRKGMTALHFASQQGHKEMVELLLSRKADPTSRNKRNETALDLCKVEGARGLLQRAIAAKEAASSARAADGAGIAKKDRHGRKARDSADEPAEQIGPQLPPGAQLYGGDAAEEVRAAGPAGRPGGGDVAGLPGDGEGGEVQGEGGGVEPAPLGTSQPGMEGKGDKGGADQAALSEALPPAKKHKVVLSYLEQDESFEED